MVSIQIRRLLEPESGSEMRLELISLGVSVLRRENRESLLLTKKCALDVFKHSFEVSLVVFKKILGQLLP